MKKTVCFIIFFIILLILNGAVFGGSAINITSPVANDSWRLGSIEYIKWKTEGIGGDYKITLRRNNNEEGIIKSSYSNYNESGIHFLFDYKWEKVGYCKNGVVAEPGTDYKIRVKKKNTNTYTDSPTFTISKKLVLKPGVFKALKCQGKIATIVGTNGNDNMQGTPGDDVILGLGGNDTIYGGGGNDRICGGNGADKLYGNTGNDRLDGGAGNDELRDSYGNNTLVGGAGNDLLRSGSGNDTLDGGAGNDDCSGGGGANNYNNCEKVPITHQVVPKLKLKQR